MFWPDACACGEVSACQKCWVDAAQQYSVTLAGFPLCGGADPNGTYVLPPGGAGGDCQCDWSIFPSSGYFILVRFRIMMLNLGGGSFRAVARLELTERSSLSTIIYQMVITESTTDQEDCSGFECGVTHTLDLLDASGSSCPAMWPATLDVDPYP